MKTIIRIVVWASVGIIFWASTACNNGELPSNSSLSTFEDSVSYAIGLNIGNDLKNSGDFTFAAGLLSRGIMDAVNEEDASLTMEEAQGIVMSFQQRMMAKQQEDQMKKAQENKATGDAFLAENKSKEGVQTTESGLQYKVLTEGNGPSPTAQDKVSVHYEGRLINGEVFDSSIQRGMPVEFSVGGVIRGWTEALQLMKKGSKWQLYIPGELAYGPQGSPPNIGPNETLIFDVELLDIVR